MTKKQKKIITITSIAMLIMIYFISNFVRLKIIEIKFDKYNNEFTEIYSELINTIDIKNLDTALTEENLDKVSKLEELIPKMDSLRTDKTFFELVAAKNFYLDIKDSFEKAKYWENMSDTEKLEVQMILIGNKSIINISNGSKHKK
ncbi:hypothetical protein [Vallitalea guaymasensis]|uniref:hypothetical protein n=1 Tax=Vallitalea guaymasensis TaxID=1185412 RepID=UPI002352F1AB|nr:hypothetical protein [Vallitalea guaymasensis]